MREIFPEKLTCSPPIPQESIAPHRANYPSGAPLKASESEKTPRQNYEHLSVGTEESYGQERNECFR